MSTPGSRSAYSRTQQHHHKLGLLRRLEAELTRLAEAIASEGNVPALVHAVRDREAGDARCRPCRRPLPPRGPITLTTNAASASRGRSLLFSARLHLPSMGLLFFGYFHHTVSEGFLDRPRPEAGDI